MGVIIRVQNMRSHTIGREKTDDSSFRMCSCNLAQRYLMVYHMCVCEHVMGFVMIMHKNERISLDGIRSFNGISCWSK